MNFIYLDKERDIQATTNRIRSELNEEFSKRQSLLNEIQQLKCQLEESKAGLLAAARISDQLEIAQVTNSAIKEECKYDNVKLNTHHTIHRRMHKIRTIFTITKFSKKNKNQTNIQSLQ